MRKVSAETRSRMSKSAKRRCTPEWRQAVSDRLSTRLPLDELRDLYNSGMTQDELAEHYGVRQKVIWAFMRRNNILSRVAAKRNQWAENNHMWKGESASYKAMHQRLTKRFGQPKRCEICGTIDRRKSYDWANLTGDFGNTDDYRRMCRSCHRKYDKKRRSARD